jgi:hypothetical protein
MAHARNTDPQTSHEAAESVKHLTQTQVNILKILLLASEPLSDEQIIDEYQKHFRISGYERVSVSGIRSRRHELEVLGRVELKGFGRTESGRRCSLWGVAND